MTKTEDIVIFGAGSLGISTLDIIESINENERQWKIVGFLDENTEIAGSEVFRYPVLGGKDWLTSHPACRIILAIGNAPKRRALASRLADMHREIFATLIHPMAIISRRSTVSAGAIVSPGVVVEHQTKIGRHVLLNRSSSVGHNVILDDFCTLSPAATIAGHCHVHEGSEIGSNATVIPQKNIGEWAIIGAGSVVTRDIAANTTAVGVPAKTIKTRHPGEHLE